MWKYSIVRLIVLNLLLGKKSTLGTLKCITNKHSEMLRYKK